MCAVPCLRGCLAGWLPPSWLAGCLAACLHDGPAGRQACREAGRLAGWLAGCQISRQPLTAMAPMEASYSQYSSSWKRRREGPSYSNEAERGGRRNEQNLRRRRLQRQPTDPEAIAKREKKNWKRISWKLAKQRYQAKPQLKNASAHNWHLAQPS